MTTAITLDMVTAQLTKRGIPWKFYKDRADALVHNRNSAPNNAVTPGGFGPLQGLFIHNFASDITDASSLNYLYTGDAARSLPGPLSQFALDDAGTVWIIGWGTANHASAGDSVVVNAARRDAMPLDRDMVPNVNNVKTLIAPYFLGIEMLYGAAPTAMQRTNIVKFSAAIMELLGYTGGSVVMHRETHADRSDPVGFKGFEIRKAINAQLAAWKAPTPTVPAPAPVPAPAVTLTTDTRNALRNVPMRLYGSVPSGVNGVCSFQWKKPDGTWDEIARVSPAANGGAWISNAPYNDVTYSMVWIPATGTPVRSNSVSVNVITPDQIAAKL